MKTITLSPLNDRLTVPTETNVLHTLLAVKCDVAMACGGQGICATCHVYVRDGWDSLSPVTKREERTLGLITGAKNTSRLACQAKVIGEGVVVEIPQAMYLRAAADLDTLIGRRAELPILHPRDGRVLIEPGKIITRSRLRELQNEDFNVLDARAQTSSL